MSFRIIPDDGQPLRVVLVGVGGMGRAWLAAITECAEVELVGLVDLDTEAAFAVAAGGGLQLTVGTDAVDVARRGGGQAVIDVTVPAAHHPVTTAALFAGMPVLGEKPVAATVAQGLSLVAAAEITGELFMVSQSRRYNEQLWAYENQISALGRTGVLTTEFFKAPHFGGFRDEMNHPLLLDMAVHQMDSARFLLHSDPVAVYCEEYNPAWSWYRGDAGCTAVYEMASGARYVFTGSWCSPGLETSWNGSWRASGEHGSATWSGDDLPVIERVAAGGLDNTRTATDLLGDGISGSLREFVRAVRTGAVPMGEVHDNIYSLAMVQAAIESNAGGIRILLHESMSRALERAISEERREDVSLVLKTWQARGGYANR